MIYNSIKIFVVSLWRIRKCGKIWPLATTEKNAKDRGIDYSMLQS